MRTILAAAEPNMALIILITGFVVVFAVLLLLIGIIKLYSTIVTAAQNKAEKKALKKKAKSAPAQPAPQELVAVPAAPAVSDGSLDLQTVAVITAAVEAYYAGNKKVRVTGIRRSSSARSEWATAGLMESMPAMRSEGLL